MAPYAYAMGPAMPDAVACNVTDIAAEAAFADDLQRLPESAARARCLVSDALGIWDLPQLQDDALLVVTEMVSNAVAHTSGPVIRVSVVLLTARRIRVSVTDRDRTRPRARPSGAECERGRGLLLIEALSCRRGVHLLRDGKAVWAELEAPS
jgi:anti-sigma regulatory factor (Ser/Thr protein kinase)